jgi:hypothetical protein
MNLSRDLAFELERGPAVIDVQIADLLRDAA